MFKNLLLCLITIPLFSFAQTNEIVEEYNRNAFSIMVIGGRTPFKADILNASTGIIIPDKFDDNMLGTTTLNATSGKAAILKELNNEKIANQIIGKWFDRNEETGEFSMSVLHQRGLYNASDVDVAQSSATKVGVAKLMDAGESLINHSYILVMEFGNIESMTQIYNKKDLKKRAAAEAMNKNFEPVRRVKNGWVGNVHGYLYKIPFNDSMAVTFYNDFWIYEDDTDAVKKAKRELFETVNLPIEYVGETVKSAEGTQYNPGHSFAYPVQLTRNQLFETMLNSGLDACIFQMERLLEDFKIKTPVYDTKPVRSKIGKKEGLKTDQRFFVMESFENAQGRLVMKRKGVVRASGIVDNRKVASGNSTEMSTFYQTAGFKLKPGMVLHQRNDYGIGILGGTSIGEIGGYWGGIQYNLSQMTGRYDFGITQLKLIASAGFQTKEYNVPISYYPNKNYDFNFIRWQVGLSKGFYFLRNFSFAPFVTYGAESGQNSTFNYDNNLTSSDFVGTDFFNFGINASLNIIHCIQIVGGVNYYTPLSYTYTKQRSVFDYSQFMNRKYTDFFEKRRNLSFDVGVRIEF